MTYLAEADGDSALTPLQAAACTYRIALGARAGQKLLSLQTVPSRQANSTQPGCVNAHGFSLHAAVRCGADQRKELERLCRYITRPAIANERRAATEERLPRRHHPHRHVAAGVHASRSPRWCRVPGCI